MAKSNDPARLIPGLESRNPGVIPGEGGYRRVFRSPATRPGPGPRGAVMGNVPPKPLKVGGAPRATSSKPREGR